MKFRAIVIAALLAAAFSGSAHHAAAFEKGRAATASGHAWAEVRRAVRKDGVLRVELQFLTDYVGYSGEKIYEDIPADKLDASIFVEFGDQTFPLWRKDGVAALPQALELNFNYDPQRNPRVGSWKADFVAPEHDVTEAVLHMPNIGPIGPFIIKDR